MSEQKRLLKQRETTESKVMRLKHTAPGVSTREIAMQLGISGEWARRLIQRNNPNYVADKTCPECHKPLEKEPKIRKMCRECYSKKANIQIRCAGCREWISRPRPVYNRSQKSPRYRGNMYCSRDCFDKNKLPYRRERVSYKHTCQKCNKVTTVYGANEKRKAKMRKFCSNCYGVKTTEQKEPLDAIVVFRVNTAPVIAELLPVGGRLSDGTVKGINDLLNNQIKRCKNVSHIALSFSNLAYQVAPFTDEAANKIFDSAKLNG